MTVKVYSGPGTDAWRSTRYSAQVNVTTAYVWMVAKTTGMISTVYSGLGTFEANWLAVETDETITVTITKLSGAITSAVVYPKDAVDADTDVRIVGGLLLVDVPPNTRLRIEIDGDRLCCMHVFTRPLQAAPDTLVDWATSLSLVVSSLNTVTDTITFAVPHSFAANAPVRLYTDGTFPAVDGTALAHNTTYYAINPGVDTIQLARTAGGAAIDFTGAGAGAWRVYPATYTNSSVALSFGAGVHEIGQLFKLGTNVQCYISGDAVLQGSFDLRGLQGVAIFGGGVLAGNWKRDDALGTRLTYDWFHTNVTTDNVRRTYALFYGVNSTDYLYNNSVNGITTVDSVFYLVSQGVWSWTNCHHLSPWTYSTDGFECDIRMAPDLRCQVIDCFAWCGDDATRMTGDIGIGETTISGCFFVNMGGSALMMGYAPLTDRSTTVCTDCHVMSLAVEDIDSAAVGAWAERGQNAAIKMWCDGDSTEPWKGRRNVTITNLKIWGPFASRWLSLENKLYPWDETVAKDAYGEIENWTFDGIWIEETPAQIGRIYGLDATNTPHDLTFTDVEIGGVAVTTDNWTDYVELNSYPYNITVDAHELAEFSVEDGTGLAAATSYCSVAEADAYHNQNGDPAAWSGATTAAKQAALQTATTYLDYVYGPRWNGVRGTSEQALDWPRLWVVDAAGYEIASNVVPTRLKHATAAAALLSVQGQTLVPTTQTGADIASEDNAVGAVSRAVTYRGSKPVSTQFPIVDRILCSAGLAASGGGWGASTV